MAWDGNFHGSLYSSSVSHDAQDGCYRVADESDQHGKRDKQISLHRLIITVAVISSYNQ